ncbi:sll0787 family AIR synthase-like protein [Pseudomonas putida]|uniref:sll0787 family AIR synthase-like protein n=1 Tax=Pseudomonas putida TaxID=303 RepID=UPI0018AC7689|nr:sll0787 family AIR synthase-like protein [Pseudomonas putida]MBF8668237.1 sll0787 family AIR synthase-like protein [Pseudomonas putida]MBF8711737.1 sll0787 family AIR synthase-like protein [Pseudomonas putida]
MNTDLQSLLATLRGTDAMRAKQAIQHPARVLPTDGIGRDALYALPGDDTAAIRCGDHYQLLAIEGMLPHFVAQAPWFAGWSAVMANVSDITAMGGRASAVVNAYWHHDEADADSLLAGIRDACRAYGLQLVGGHTSQAPGNPTALAVAITGWARSLLSTLHVQPGQCLAMAVDLDGCWHGDAPYWKAFEGVPHERLRAKLDIIPRLAEAGLLQAAKDISNAGVLGTLLMLLEPTGCGAQIDLAQLPRPAGTPLERWLRAFPSYGFLLTLAPRDLPDVEAAFAFEGLHCAAIGQIDDSARLTVCLGRQHHEFWNLDHQPFTGFSYPKEH